MNQDWLSGREEQRETVQSPCSVYSLSTGNAWGVHTTCINAFVIWRSSQIINSFKILLYIYWKNTCTCKGRSQLPTKQILWLVQMRNGLLSLYAGHLQWKNIVCPLSPSSRETPGSGSLKIIWCTNWNTHIKKTWSNPTLNCMSTPLTSVELCVDVN